MKFNSTENLAPASASEPTRLRFLNRVSEWTGRHPILAIVLVSLLAVVISCYPIIFCGKSYVSPGCVLMLVYDSGPPLPGIDPAKHAYIWQHGSDCAATMWWAVPAGFIESRSILQHGAIPLWNRYGHAGDTLIGQAVSMLGDPLQLIVILGHGSAAAWDVKFLLAKLLFCIGFGLLVLRLLGSRALALAYAAMAAYCGAFYFVNDHPAFFVLCYAPWILLSALAWFDGASGRRHWWGITWLAANFACFNAGDVEVAAVLIGGLNLVLAVYALLRARNVIDRAMGSWDDPFPGVNRAGVDLILGRALGRVFAACRGSRRSTSGCAPAGDVRRHFLPAPH